MNNFFKNWFQRREVGGKPRASSSQNVAGVPSSTMSPQPAVSGDTGASGSDGADGGEV